MSENFFLVSRNKVCKNNESIDPDDWIKCAISDATTNDYTIVYTEKHLDKKEYKCGCLIYRNKYYSEFTFNELIWLDFFKFDIKPGEGLVKFFINKLVTSKKNTKKRKRK